MDCTNDPGRGWRQRAAALSPLLDCADASSWGGEDGVLRALFAELPRQAGFAVEFGQRSLSRGTVATIVREQGWSALLMDVEAPAQTRCETVDGGGTVTLARERIAPSNIEALFRKYGVPAKPDCLVIDLDGLDYWVWEAIGPDVRPALVVVEYNVHVGPRLQASIVRDEAWNYRRTKDYGASFAALCDLAARKGYRLVHVHGPWNLYFLRGDLSWPESRSVRPDLTDDEFAILTDTAGFYDALCGGKRPSWFDAPAPDVSRAPWEILCPPQRSRTIDIAGTTLRVLADMHDVQWYQQRPVYEERHSLLYPMLDAEGFATLVDVGANVGMISIFARQGAPAIRPVCVEADPQLVRLLRANLAHHGIDDAVIVNAIADREDCREATFSLNPKSTLDNRVRVDDWPHLCVPAVRMDRLLSQLSLPGPVFIKIDTQGFELNVLLGLTQFLSSRGDWLLKMEFAPDWLESQGTDPMDVLEHLQAHYQFAELVERVPYGMTRTDELFVHPVGPGQHAAFVRHVRAQNRNDLGWVDLVVRPRPDSPARGFGAAGDGRSETGAAAPVDAEARHADRFTALPRPELAEPMARQRCFHDMQLPGLRTGSWVYGPELPPNYHLWPVFRYLNELDLSGATCLDIGTYDGMTAFSMAARGAARVDATCQHDLERFRIARALGQWTRVAYFAGTDLDDIHASFAGGQYDLVVMSAMLHHLLSPLEALIEARRLLKPSGYLVVEVVVREGPAAAVLLNTALEDPVYGRPTIWIPSAEAALAMLRFAGFAVISRTRLIGTKRARESNYDRITVLAQAVAADAIPERGRALSELHAQVRQIGRHRLAPDVPAAAVHSALAYRGPTGERTLNPFHEPVADPLQPDWTDPDPARHTFVRVADNADFARLVARHPDGAFTVDDLRHLPSRYPGQVMPEGMRWGLKQLGCLHVLDHVRDLGLVDVLEVGPGFNLYFPNHLPPWCHYTGLDDAGFYDQRLIAEAERHPSSGRRVRGLLGRREHGLGSDSFDACFSVSVLEHVPDDAVEAVCADMHALLRPGGWALHSIDLAAPSARERGRRWLGALREAGFVVNDHAVAIDPASITAPFTEPLSITATFYSGFRPSIWGGATLRSRANPMTLLVAMRKRLRHDGPAVPV